MRRRACTVRCTDRHLGQTHYYMAEVMRPRIGVGYIQGPCPRPTGFAGSKGALVAAQVMTYGRQNNEPAFVQQQAPLGVQAVIVDDVARIAAMYPGERAFFDA